MPKSKSSKPNLSSQKTPVFRPWIITTICILGFLRLLFPSFALWAFLSPFIIAQGGFRATTLLLPILLIPVAGFFIIFSLWKMKKWVFVFYMLIFVTDLLGLYGNKPDLDTLFSGIIPAIGLIYWKKLR